MESEYMYNIEDQEAEMVYNSDNTCTVFIDGEKIRTFSDGEKAYKYLRRNGFQF